mmetsp:Transcript_11654/g.17704  ORF Transcript_11654/g.17704 Transcript_11654/m.17704 type:complete len:147 (-) Transcript_11654:618-1058(-)
MTSREKKRLFKLFGVLKSTKQQNSKGIGLDLVICKLISQEFGGDLSVVSKKGVGSLFTFCFKLHDNQKPDEMFKPPDLIQTEDRDLLESNGTHSLQSESSGESDSLSSSSPGMHTCLAGMESGISKRSQLMSTPEKKRSSYNVSSN